VRVAKNVYEHSYLLSQVLLRQWINRPWFSILILGPVLLILLGWGYSVWQTGGGLLEWYFALHEAIYLLWPWNLESRFFLPVAPLACLYLWRGVQSLVLLMRNKAKQLGAVWLPVSALLLFCIWMSVHGSWGGQHIDRFGLQLKASIAVWIGATLAAVWMLFANTSWTRTVSGLSDRFTTNIDYLRTSPQRLCQLLGALLAFALIIGGLRMQLEIAQNNSNLKFVATLITPDARAGQWLAAHTDSDAVVMARYLPTVYHYSHRKMVWFPANSDAKVLMEGIERLKVEYVVVTQRKSNYYLPPDLDCFTKLAAAYPTAFDLVEHQGDFWIYRVAPHPQQK
jgi:hypothetical protein